MNASSIDETINTSGLNTGIIEILQYVYLSIIVDSCDVLMGSRPSR